MWVIFENRADFVRGVFAKVTYAILDIMRFLDKILMKPHLIDNLLIEYIKSRVHSVKAGTVTPS